MIYTLLCKLANRRVFDWTVELLSIVEEKYGVAPANVYFAEAKTDPVWGLGVDGANAAVSLLLACFLFAYFP